MAKVRIEPGGVALISIVVLGALLFLFFEFVPTRKKPKVEKPEKSSVLTKSANSSHKQAGAVAGVQNVTETNVPPSTESKTHERSGFNTPIRIYFAFNKAHVNKNVYCIFDRIQNIVRREGVSGIRIVVEGNADSIGASWYNVELSRWRATRVADSLSGRLGVPLKNISIVANGSSKPIASNSTAAGRADNRRTDILIYH